MSDVFRRELRAIPGEINVLYLIAVEDGIAGARVRLGPLPAAGCSAGRPVLGGGSSVGSRTKRDEEREADLTWRACGFLVGMGPKMEVGTLAYGPYLT